ncbi:hypothetical protein GvMRE_IIg181 [endosymbiont GvMRE of Glomus versiforme]|nr:hypothetical protein GvMRE_IIg181 [endosymbiont GvMRE of Glomus versiforme]
MILIISAKKIELQSISYSTLRKTDINDLNGTHVILAFSEEICKQTW